MAETLKRNYIVVSGEHSEALEDAVETHIKLGFKPLGGVAVAVHEWTNERKGYSETSCVFAQAMVRK